MYRWYRSIFSWNSISITLCGILVNPIVLYLYTSSNLLIVSLELESIMYLSSAMASSNMASMSVTASFHNEHHSFKVTAVQMPFSFMSLTTSDIKLIVLSYSLCHYWNLIAMTLIYIVQDTAIVHMTTKPKQQNSSNLIKGKVMLLPNFSKIVEIFWKRGKKDSRQNHSSLLYILFS